MRSREPSRGGLHLILALLLGKFVLLHREFFRGCFEPNGIHLALRCASPGMKGPRDRAAGETGPDLPPGMEPRPDSPPLVEVREAVPAEPVPEWPRDPYVVPGPDPSCEPDVTARPHNIPPFRGLLGMREEQNDAGSGHFPHLGRPKSLPTPVGSPTLSNHGASPVRSSEGGIQLPHAGHVRAKWDTRLWQDGHRRVPGGSGGGGGGSTGGATGHAPGAGAISGRGGGGGGKGEGAPNGGGGGGSGSPPGTEGGI